MSLLRATLSLLVATLLIHHGKSPVSRTNPATLRSSLAAYPSPLVVRCISTRPRSKFGPHRAECLSKPCSENAFLDLPVVNVIVNLYLSIALYIKYNLWFYGGALY